MRGLERYFSESMMTQTLGRDLQISNVESHLVLPSGLHLLRFGLPNLQEE